MRQKSGKLHALYIDHFHIFTLNIHSSICRKGLIVNKYEFKKDALPAHSLDCTAVIIHIYNAHNLGNYSISRNNSIVIMKSYSECLFLFVLDP